MQLGHRLAAIGILLAQYGQSLSVGSSGASSLRLAAFMALITMKMANAMMIKSITRIEMPILTCIALCNTLQIAVFEDTSVVEDTTVESSDR